MTFKVETLENKFIFNKRKGWYMLKLHISTRSEKKKQQQILAQENDKTAYCDLT